MTQQHQGFASRHFALRSAHNALLRSVTRTEDFRWRMYAVCHVRCAPRARCPTVGVLYRVRCVRPTLYVWCMYASRNVTLRTVEEIEPIVRPTPLRK